MPRTAFAARGICGFGLCGRAAWEPLHRFQSTRPVWGATGRCGNAEIHREISIHAPRVGRDAPAAAQGFHCRNFNPRAPCGARHIAAAPDHKHTQFQSTRPVWGATSCASSARSCAARFQSTRPVWGATDGSGGGCWEQRISIHAPRVGRDYDELLELYGDIISIHAPRVGRDHYLIKCALWHRVISIHAPRVGRDYFVLCLFRLARDFNPRAPCGARLRSEPDAADAGGFQSTRPVWGATSST